MWAIKKKPDPTAFLECICQANTLENSPKEPLYKAPDFTAAPGECFDAAARPPVAAVRSGSPPAVGRGRNSAPGRRSWGLRPIFAVSTVQLRGECGF